MWGFAIEIFQSICLIVAAIVILITALGILRLDDDMEKVIYARIHMLGMVDIACVLAMIGLSQYLLAGIYFVLAPFVAHAMANAYYYGEDDRKYESNDELTGRVNDTIYTELALNKSTTIDAKFKSVFESNIASNDNVSKDNISNDDVSNDNVSNNNVSNVASVNATSIKSDLVSYTKSEESKGNISEKLDVVIKEVTTDDIENSSLNKDNAIDDTLDDNNNKNNNININNSNNSNNIKNKNIKNINNSNNSNNNGDNKYKDENGGEKHD